MHLCGRGSEFIIIIIIILVFYLRSIWSCYVQLGPSRRRRHSTRKEFLVDLASHDSFGARLGHMFDLFMHNKFKIQGLDFLCNHFLAKVQGV